MKTGVSNVKKKKLLRSLRVYVSVECFYWQNDTHHLLRKGSSGHVEQRRQMWRSPRQQLLDQERHRQAVSAWPDPADSRPGRAQIGKCFLGEERLLLLGPPSEEDKAFKGTFFGRLHCEEIRCTVLRQCCACENWRLYVNPRRSYWWLWCMNCLKFVHLKCFDGNC